MEKERADAGRDGTANPFRETKFSDTNGATGKTINFPVQLNTSRIGNQLMPSLLNCMNTYILVHATISTWNQLLSGSSGWRIGDNMTNKCL